MNVTLEIPDDRAAAYRREAAARGMTVDRWLLMLAEQNATSSAAAELQKNPEEWIRRLREWADSHDPNLPVLSDEAMSRESIY